MSRPTTDRRPPIYDGSPKHCSLCVSDKPRTPDNFSRTYSKLSRTDGLMSYCIACHHALVAANRRRRIALEDGPGRLARLRLDHLRGLAMLNVMLSIDIRSVGNADLVRLGNAELARLQTLPIIPEPKPKGRRRCTRPSN